MVRGVAVIGVGAMGGPIARRILDGGFELTVCDRSEDALRAFDGASVTATTRPADCSAADVVLVLVLNADQVREVVLGEEGITSGAHRPLLAVMSTVGPTKMLDLQEELAPTGLRLIDAPISGGQVRAEEGRLSVILGGEQADVAAVRPVMDCLGPQVFHCGPVGSAQAVKIGNNILGMINTYAAAEVYRLMLEHGLNLDEIAPIIDASTGRNWLSATPGEAASSFKSFTASRRAFEGPEAIMRKDAGLALELVARSSGSFPVIEAMASLVDSLGEETFENWKFVGSASSAEPPQRSA